jgi:hypothetical protein
MATDSMREIVMTGDVQAPDQTVHLLRSPGFEALLWPSCRPTHSSAWHGHVSFGHWLVQSIQPRAIVELGTHNGVSFASFCNAVRQSGLPTRCFAVDTWVGDAHSGRYDADVYLDLLAFTRNNFASFATLVRGLFDEALEKFADGTVDLLHIDGLHTYNAVRHDFDTWLPKLSARGVVLFHDTEVRGGDFGVWKLWDELSPRYPHFNFVHSSGLGVLAVGSTPPQPVSSLCALDATEAIGAVRERFRVLSEFACRNGIQDIDDRLKALSSRLGKNIALHCSAFQSSAEYGEPSPQGAVNGVKTGRFAFHTKYEKNPWWMLDFGEQKIFDHIVVYNRLDEPCRRRALTLSVLISADAASWAELYAHDGTSFGGNDGSPLHIRCPASRARFVRLQLNESNFLHLDQVEIFAEEKTSATGATAPT